jgi:hypothetical protein
MPWNEKDFTRWRAQSYARLGVDHAFDATRINGVTNFLTVPANHIYLIRNVSGAISNMVAAAANGYIQIQRAVGEIFTVSERYFPAVISSLSDHISFSYPFPVIAGGFVQLYSSAAGLMTRVSIYYTDVDLLLFPAYDPGW